MSLLMQALKKAEHAKKGGLQESPVPADSPSNFPAIEVPVAAEENPLRVEPELDTGPTEPARPALELSPQLPDQPASAEPPALTLESLAPQPELPMPAAPASQPRISTPATSPAASPQKKAQTVMAASQTRGSNRVMVFGIGAVLIAALCAAAAYYYWQSTAGHPGPVALNGPVATRPVQAPVPMPAEPAAPDLKPASVQAPQPAAQTDNGARVAHRKVRVQAGLPTAAAAAAAPAPAKENIQVQRNQAASTVNANLSKAYQLFMSGDNKGARPLYEAVLHEEHNNRDALLGMAAIALRQRQNEQAAALYSKLLDLDPADPDAIAGLTSLGKGDPERAESQLKKLLARNPQFGPALFELGNVYAQQSRWTEAQDAYFRAFASTPGNASYAFNLAISLDRLGQSKLALDYYQKALALGNAAPGSFNPDPAKVRAAQLQQTLNTEPARP